MCLLPTDMTDVLQQMDVVVNKPAKKFINRRFEHWYSEEVIKQLDGKDMDDLVIIEIQSVDLSM